MIDARMLQCVRSFRARYDGELEVFSAGRTWVRADHEIVRRYPHHFATGERRPTPAAQRPRRHRQRSTTLPTWELPAAIRSPRLSLPRLDSWPEERELVTLGATAANALHDWAWGYTRSDGAEVAGWLHGDGLHITDADCSHSNQSRTGVTLVRRQDESTVIGDWHTHPAPQNTRPSAGDLAGWAEELSRSGRDTWIGVILAPDEAGGWSRPAMDAWLVRASFVGLRCERAEVVRG